MSRDHDETELRNHDLKFKAKLTELMKNIINNDNNQDLYNGRSYLYKMIFKKAFEKITGMEFSSIEDKLEHKYEAISEVSRFDISNIQNHSSTIVNANVNSNPSQKKKTLQERLDKIKSDLEVNKIQK